MASLSLYYPHLIDNAKRIDGNMSYQGRRAAIHAFKKRGEITVCLISLKASSYGLNLVEANHVLICDPWWNPAVEQQAVERCHRIGQSKPVEVVSFICTSTIEERVLDLHC